MPASESTMPSSSEQPKMVLSLLGGLALSAACAYNPSLIFNQSIINNLQRQIFGLGWYLAPVVTSLLIVFGTTIPNRATDHILRYPNKSGRWPTLFFSALRMLDPLLVGWLMLPTLMSAEGTGRPPLRAALMLGMATVGALRHAFWVTCINLNEWNWELSIIVAVFNNWFDWTHAKCLLKRLAEEEAKSNDGNNGDSLAWIGVVFFVIGCFLETHSERQRRRFKDDARNKGKLYTGGLFGHARHINYLGYILWRTGLGFVSGPPYTLSYGVYHAIDFYIRAIPLLQNHMQSKYGDQWTEYTKQTKSVLIPSIL